MKTHLDFRKGKCCFATLRSTYLIFYFNHLHKIFYTPSFTEGLKTETDLEIAILTPSPVDVTFLQLLHSFLTKCRSINKKVFFEINGKDEFIAELIKMGYYDVTSLLNPAYPREER